MSDQDSSEEKKYEPRGDLRMQDSARDLPNIQSPEAPKDKFGREDVVPMDAVGGGEAGHAEPRNTGDEHSGDDDSSASLSNRSLDSGAADLPAEDSQMLQAEEDSLARSNDDDLLHIEAEDEGSDIFDTDSSADEPETVAPTFQLQPKPEVKKAPELAGEEEYAEEMGGILVYDSHAHLKGCKKIEEYWDARVSEKLHVDVLFSKQEQKEVARDFFAERARERDFASDHDKATFKNLPRFQAQRDFASLPYSISVPNY